MSPQPSNILWMNFGFISSAYSDDKFPEISQVKDIMHFRRSWKEFFKAICIKLNAMFQERSNIFLFRMTLERNTQDRCENSCQSLFIKIGYRKQTYMP